MQHSINWVAVVVAALAGMFVGFLWYGLAFQDLWAEAVNITQTDETFFKDGREVALDSTVPMVINGVAMLLYSVFFAWLTGRSGHTTFVAGAGLGAVTGIVTGFSHFITNLFALEPAAITWIDGPYHVVLFAVIGGIVGGWRKK